MSFSADEAIAAGATSVVFNQPVIQYAENFLNFPVGTPVPTGVYDVQKALRADFLERAGVLPAETLASLDAGLRLVLNL